MTLNSFILSKISKNNPNLPQLNTPIFRFQILSIFYLNFIITFFSFSFETFTLLQLNSSFSKSLAIICSSGSFLSFFFLYRGNFSTAGIFLLSYLHLANLLLTIKFDAPLAGIFGPFCFMKLAYTITDSPLIIILNTLASFAEIIFHLFQLSNLFEITLSHEQHIQICFGLLALFLTFTYFSTVNFLENNFQSRLWNIIQSNFEKAENLTKEILQVVEAKDCFVSSLSHEVRNIVNLLTGSVDYLLELIKNRTCVQVLKNIKMSGDILLNLVNNTLDAAKIKANKLELAFDHADFEEIVKKALIINSERLKNKNICAEAIIDTNIPKELWIDSGRLLQIIINLLSNAIKFTPDNGQIYIHATWCEGERSQQALTTLIKDHRSPKINHSATEGTLMITEEDEGLDVECDVAANSSDFLEFSFEEETRHQRNLSALERCPQTKVLKELELQQQQPSVKSWQIKKIRSFKSRTNLIMPHRPESPKRQAGYLKVQVSDTGCGIAEEELPKLFGMYSQANNHAGSHHGGTGLGLWICQQLCEKMNGEISVYSHVNQGTDFVFYIPVKFQRMSSTSLQEIERPRQRKVNSLVVADSKFSQNLLKLLLEREGVEVMVASSGTEALRKCQVYSEKGGVDFIFMDMDVLSIYGISSVEKIREWELKKGLKSAEIYLLSGNYFNEEDEHIPEELNVGSKELLDSLKYMKKPVEVKKISRIVEEYRLKYL